jgi:redox-sensitive bicupin YhaK (pirin superfamily)
MSFRPTLETRKAQPTMEGAGVHLHRAFGFQDPSELDPFLLFDDFRNDVPTHYLQGFPWNPHRGIETITFVLSETVEHGESQGNTGRLSAGVLEWMTTVSGIMHQEMPQEMSRARCTAFNSGPIYPQG